MTWNRLFLKTLNIFNILISVCFIVLFFKKKKKDPPPITIENLSKSMEYSSDDDFVYINEPQLK
jgi:hypothetical protein